MTIKGEWCFALMLKESEKPLDITTFVKECLQAKLTQKQSIHLGKSLFKMKKNALYDEYLTQEQGNLK